MDTIVLSHALYKPGMDLLEKNRAQVIIPNNGDSDVIIDDLKKADGFILRIGKIDRKAIEACPNLKVITRPGVGVDNVDVKAATEHGIPVVICPGANALSVAEHTLGLIFAIAKDVVEYDTETRKGNFAIRNKYKAVEIGGKTLAVFGFGHIGQVVARLAAGVGMNIAVYDPFCTREKVESEGYKYFQEKDEILKRADFVTLHMPSLPDTKGMANKAFFECMKSDSYFINCARGDIVDETALYDALKNGSIAGAAVDVLSKEPMDSADPLMTLHNFIVSPHSAGQTKEATTKIVTMAAEGTLAVLRGEKWKNVCNPEVYDHPKWREV